MGIAEAMTTFVADKCKKGNCAGCTHARCTHECHKIETANNGESVEAPAAEAMPDATAPSGEVQGQNNPADAGAEPTPNGEDPGSIAEATAVATSAAPDPDVTDGGDSEGGHGSHVASEAPVGAHFDELPIEWLAPAPNNVRRDIGDIRGLAESIKANGILEPLVVERVDGTAELYSIVAGHRRYAAAVEAGLAEVPCMVRPAVSDAQRVELMLIENLQRADLAPLEESEGYRRLAELGMAQRTIAGRVGCTQAHVSHRLALLKLPDKIRKALDNGVITVTDAREIMKLPDPESQKKAFERRDSYRGIAAEVENLLREIEWERKRTKALGELEVAGVRILERQYRGRDEQLERIGSEDWQLNVDLDEHAKLDCHAAFVERDGRVVLFCTKPEGHPEELRRLEEPDDDDEPAPEIKDDDPEAVERLAKWEAEREERQRQRIEQQRLVEEARANRTEAMRAIVESFDRQAASEYVLEQFIALATDSDGYLWTRAGRVLELLGLDDVDLDKYEGLNAEPEDLVIQEHAGTNAVARQQTALALALAVGETALSSSMTHTLDAAEAFVACLERHEWEVPEADRQTLEELRSKAAAEAEAIAEQRATEAAEA